MSQRTHILRARLKARLRVILTGAVSLLALGLIGVGAWAIYKPLGPLVVGALLWADLSSGSRP